MSCKHAMTPNELREAWQFTEAMNESRRQLLSSAPEWEVIRSLLFDIVPRFNGMEIRIHDSECGPGWSRATWCYLLSTDEFDLFYNGPTGYRAQFCLGDSAEHGRAENHRLIKDVRSGCLGKVPADLADLATRSIDAIDAKVCVEKDDIPDVDRIDIAFEPWVRRRDTEERYANTGVIAPIATHVWIKGGWVRGEFEWRDPAKGQRAESFRANGFG